MRSSEQQKEHESEQETPLSSVLPVTFSQAPATEVRGPVLSSPKRPLRFRRALLAGAGLGALSQTAIGESSPAQKPEVESELPEAPLPQRWQRKEVEIILDPSLQELGPKIEDYIEAAFSTWNESGAELPQVHFKAGKGAEASLEPDGKSTILVAPIEFEGHEADLAITIGFSNPKTGEVSEADIVINQKHVFAAITEAQVARSSVLADSSAAPDDQVSCSGSLDAQGCNSSYDLQNVLTHEVGHFWGLGENYDDPQATMFSCTSACETHKRDLERSDATTLSELYAGTAEAAVVEGCSPLQIGAATTNAPGLWLLCAGAGALFWARRAARRTSTGALARLSNRN